MRMTIPRMLSPAWIKKNMVTPWEGGGPPKK
jgi:hypothetical protein